MPEHHTRHTDADQSGPLGGREVVEACAERLQRGGQGTQLAAVVEGGHEQADPGGLGKRLDAVTEPGEDPVEHRRRRAERIRHRRVAAQALLGGEHRGQLHQRQRVALRLGDELVAYGRGQVRRVIGDDPSGRLGLEPPQPQLRQAAAGEVRLGLPGREHHGHALGVEPPGSEQQRVGRLAVQPVRVVDQAHQRRGRRHLDEQAQRREPDQEPVPAVGATQPERAQQGIRLLRRQCSDPGQFGTQQHVQSRERQVGLRLDAGDPQHARLRVLRRILQQRRLADAGLAADDQRPGAAARHIEQQPFDHLLLSRSAVEHRLSSGLVGRGRTGARRCRRGRADRGGRRHRSAVSWLPLLMFGLPGVRCEHVVKKRDLVRGDDLPRP